MTINDTGRHDYKPCWTGWIEIVGNQPTARTKASSTEDSHRRGRITTRDGYAALKMGRLRPSAPSLAVRPRCRLPYIRFAALFTKLTIEIDRGDADKKY